MASRGPSTQLTHYPLVTRTRRNPFMRVTLQLVISHDDGHEETVTDVITLTKHHQRIEHLGLSLAESKQLLGTLQRHILQQQVTTFLDTQSRCPDCGTPLKLKAHGS